MRQLKWHNAPYEKLSVDEFHDIAALRIEIFVVEQDCPYQELDGLDKIATHLWATDEETVVACLRILPPGASYTECAIGRVVVSQAQRGTGLGHELMKRGMDMVKELYGPSDIKISAQEHLKSYYEKHEFKQCGDGYLEDGIPHIPMKYTSVSG
jgi:ElaA protein